MPNFLPTLGSEDLNIIFATFITVEKKFCKKIIKENFIKEVEVGSGSDFLPRGSGSGSGSGFLKSTGSGSGSGSGKVLGLGTLVRSVGRCHMPRPG